jgi:hypothetical protein
MIERSAEASRARAVEEMADVAAIASHLKARSATL